MGSIDRDDGDLGGSVGFGFARLSDVSLSQGPKCAALINRYIADMLSKGEPPQMMWLAGANPRSDNNDTIANVGLDANPMIAAARENPPVLSRSPQFSSSSIICIPETSAMCRKDKPTSREPRVTIVT